MCKGKVSFQNIGAAKATAREYNQRVYECPVCFCYHCTSLEDWKDEFVPIEKYNELKKQYEILLTKPTTTSKIERYKDLIWKQLQIIRQKNRKIKELNKKIN